VLNPGRVPARGYFDVADVIVTFEGPFAAYGTRERDPLPERSAHLVYGATREQALAAVARADAPRYAYFTSGSLPHPWGTVPEYLASELAALGDCA
jgi:hypothetical protein